MDFNIKYNIRAEAKAVLGMKSPLETFKPEDIGTFVLAWSSADTSTAVRGTLLGFGCDSEGEYAEVKAWTSGLTARYTLVAPLPEDMLPFETNSVNVKKLIWRDPEVKTPGIPL